MACRWLAKSNNVGCSISENSGMAGEAQASHPEYVLGLRGVEPGLHWKQVFGGMPLNGLMEVHVKQNKLATQITPSLAVL